MNSSVSIEEFGKDNGLIHEAVVTGRKVGAGREFWSRLAHDENLFREVIARVVGMIVAPQPFDSVQLIGKGWSLIAEEHDARNDALTEVYFAKVNFDTCLKDGESCIKGEEKLKRMKVNSNIRLGATTFMGLWEDYQAKGKDSILERLHQERGITYLDFFGDVLLTPRGNRRVLFLYRHGDVWHWRYSWLGHGWLAEYFSLSLAG